jgi:hypothetical protein
MSRRVRAERDVRPYVQILVAAARLAQQGSELHGEACGVGCGDELSSLVSALPQLATSR